MHCPDISCPLFADMPLPPTHSRHMPYTPLLTSTLLLPYFESQQPPYFVQLCHISSNSRPHTISIQALCHLFAGITASRADVITHIGQARRTGKREKKPKLQSKDYGFHEELIVILVFILH